MSIKDIQAKLFLELPHLFYYQKELLKCVKETGKEHNITEEEVLDFLLKDTNFGHLFYGNESIVFSLYLLKHENEKLSPYAIKDLKEIGITKKYLNIGKNYGSYEYSFYDMSTKKYERYLSPDYQLKYSGVTTIEIIPPHKLKKYQEEFDNTLINFPEYLRDPQDPTLDIDGNKITYVAGGFAALGNPASFHNPLSRTLRKKGYKKMFQLMKQYIFHFSVEDKGSYYLQALSDRMMYRQKGQAPVAEAWHRDVMPSDKIEYEDEIFGGWINLDSVDQYFSCIPGSHADKVQKTLDPGFSTLTDAVQKIYKKAGEKKPSDKELKPYINEITKDKYLFKVPPGHMIIFPQYILHEVVANKAKYNMRRQFTGWRLTYSKTPLYPMKMFDEQAVIPLPGGMIPPMYSRNHLMYFQDKPFKISEDVKYSLTEWSEATFKKECLVKVKKGEGYIVERHMKSLKDYGFKMYPPYNLEEKEIYIGKKVK